MRRELRAFLNLALAHFVVLELLLIVAIVWWPNFEESLGGIKKLAKLPVLAKQVDLIEMYGVGAYVVGQHYFKACNTLGAAAAVLFAMNAVAGEAHRGTLEIWLARPVTRTRLYTERWVLGQLAIALPVLITSLTIPPLLRTVDANMAYGPLVACSIHQSLFLGALFSLTFLFSTFSTNPLKIALGMLFVSIFQFAIYMVKTLTDWSLFRLVDIQAYVNILNSGKLSVPTTAVLIAANLAFYAVGLAIFKRRIP